MFAFRNTLFVVSLFTVAPGVFAQTPAMAGALHTVSVILPPRLKVDIAPLSAATTRNSGLTLKVSGSQAWTLAVSQHRTRAQATRFAAPAPATEQTRGVNAAHVSSDGSTATGSSPATLVVLANQVSNPDRVDQIVLTVAAR